MSKIKKLYFSHDIRSSEDIKMLKLVNEYAGFGYGVYWLIIELLHDTNEIEVDELIELISLKKFGDINEIKKVIEYCISIKLLHKNNDNLIFCNRVYENIKKMEEQREKCSRGGIATREKRLKELELKNKD